MDRPRSVEEVRKLVDEIGIEFSFAQFVEDRPAGRHRDGLEDIAHEP